MRCSNAPLAVRPDALQCTDCHAVYRVWRGVPIMYPDAAMPSDLVSKWSGTCRPVGGRDKDMKISVVLTTYKRAHLLARTIDSILVQTNPDFELIVSDNCSPDNTEEIGRKYEALDSRVRYRRNNQNLLMPGNLNAGIREAQGEYVANLHDGDVYDARLLEKWAGALDTYPSAAFVFNAYRSLDELENETKIDREPLPPCFPGTLLLEKIYFRRWRFNSPVWGTVMARRT
ncbi:MAG TPA: glycosyltransferase family 2 protein, partial [Myxococcota bacterium]|nr:glycosyltransferase family 2 protein [Myxococcota bacterium]